jgi:hypothetical protein
MAFVVSIRMKCKTNTLIAINIYGVSEIIHFGRSGSEKYFVHIFVDMKK